MICLVNTSKLIKFNQSKPRKLRAIWTVDDPNMGMVYSEDYSDNYVKRTLPDKVYVTGHTTSMGIDTEAYIRNLIKKFKNTSY